ncbi:hypothetical protein CRG98_024048 [Punica granatum]|uniref:Uncharacterized protein n=1 Tax=Punica granatum TaxID=22663 RepID=A0A2I0JH13_PUNGR|nr:hypothetical protein CRG98_024048 [Punica granatum]
MGNWSHRGNAGPAGTSPAARQQKEVRTGRWKSPRGEGLGRGKVEELGFTGNIHSIRRSKPEMGWAAELRRNAVDGTDEGTGHWNIEPNSFSAVGVCHQTARITVLERHQFGNPQSVCASVGRLAFVTPAFRCASVNLAV